MDQLLDSVVRVLHTIALYLPIIAPAGLALVSSAYDGSFEKENHGHLFAKLCFSGISFDVWGFVTLFRDEASLGASTNSANIPVITEGELGVGLLIFLFIHMLCNYWCLRLSKRKQREWHIVARWWFMVSISVFAPVALLYTGLI